MSIIIGCNGSVWVSYVHRQDTEDPQPPPKPSREQLQQTARIANSLRALSAHRFAVSPVTIRETYQVPCSLLLRSSHHQGLVHRSDTAFCCS